MNSYALQERISGKLLLWGILDTLSGIFLLLAPWGRFLQELGLQALVWGAINIIIAVVGLWTSRQKSRAHDAGTINGEHARRHLRNLGRILAINAWLDFAYITVGLLLFIGMPWSYPGHGMGIMIQGGFLLVFDNVYLGVCRRLAQDTEDS